MSFIAQTSKLFEKLPEFKFQAVLFGRDALYIEGARPVRLDGDVMVFRTPSYIIEISGVGLKIKDISDDCISIVGRVSGFSVKDI